MQAEACLKTYDIEVVSKDVEVIEIQSHDPLDIVKHKVISAYQITQEPVVVCDHFWSFHALNGWPGGYMKDMNHWLDEKDFLNLMKDKKDRRVTFTEAISYTADGIRTEVFTAQFSGAVVTAAKGTGYVPAERVIVFDGQTKTIAEQIDAGHDSRNMNDSAWHMFGSWYQANKE